MLKQVITKNMLFYTIFWIRWMVKLYIQKVKWPKFFDGGSIGLNSARLTLITFERREYRIISPYLYNIVLPYLRKVWKWRSRYFATFQTAIINISLTGWALSFIHWSKRSTCNATSMVVDPKTKLILKKKKNKVKSKQHVKATQSSLKKNQQCWLSTNPRTEVKI